MTRPRVPGWLAGAVAATLTLIAIGFVSIGFFASGGGLVIAGVVAISIGMAVAAIVEPARAGSNAGIVAFYVFALGAFYLLTIQAFVGTQPGARGGPGVSRGGPGVYPPMQRDDAPATYPPQRLNLHGAMILQPAVTATVFEGARVIAGDGSAPIDNAAFVVDGDRITAVGPKGSVQAPPNARRVDLTGKTVMPALIDAHVHLGYRRGTSFTAANYTRENLLDTLDRFSYFGVA